MRILAVVILLVVGNAALITALKGRNYAIQRLHRDLTGDVFAAPPDASWRVRGEGYDLDYHVGVVLPRPEDRGLPATRATDPLDDMRIVAAWTRDHLAVGDFYREQPWSLDRILTAAEMGRAFFCATYSRALVTVAETCGYPARVVGLNGHITSEVFDSTRAQWVMVDALYDCIPFGPDGEPLSLLETHRALASGDSVEWRAITGIEGDDDDMDPATRHQVEGIIRTGDFTFSDGRTTFGRVPFLERVRDLLAWRTHNIQLALHGEPAKDAVPARLRLSIIALNLFGALLLGWLVWRRPPARAT